MKTLIALSISILSVQFAHAQAGAQLDVNDPGATNGYGLVRFSNPMGDKINGVDVSDIVGSPYYKDGWSPGVIVLSNDKAVQLDQLKVNLCNNEVLYIDSLGREMAVDDANVKKVVVLNAKDTSKIDAVFLVIKGYMGKPAGILMQALNQGGIQLLKVNAVEVKKRDYDVMSGKTSYTFQPNVSYVFYKNNEVVACKNLNKADVFTSLLPDAAANTWLANNKNKLKNEKDVVAFLDYYNSQK